MATEKHTDPQNINLPRLYSVEILSLRWDLKPATVRALARRGLLPGIKVGDAWRFREQDLLELLERLR